MNVAEGLRTYLLGDTAIAAVVVARIYPVRLPQNAFSRGGSDGPQITLTRINEIERQHLRGPGGLREARYQVDAWARTFDAAISLGALCRTRLDGFSGDFTDGGSPAATMPVSVLFLEAIDLVEDEIGGGLFRHSADYRVFYRSD